MEEVAFFAGAIGALGGAIAVIALRNPFYSVLALVIHLVSLAGLFLLLHAEFIAAAQVVVYAGAVMVLYVFVAAYVGNIDEPLWEPIPGQRIIAPLLGGALFIELSVAILGTGLTTFGDEGPTIPAGFGSPEAIGTLLLEKFLIAFEAASLLLLIAAVGAVVLAGRRDDPADPSDASTPPIPRKHRTAFAPSGGEATFDDEPTTSASPSGAPDTAPTTAAPLGGSGEGPADTQVARQETSDSTIPGGPGRTSAGPSPGPPHGGLT